ncbi:putative protein kinase RLK-Pelle-LRR-XII-1 family [Dioscorea sansibarensis]
MIPVSLANCTRLEVFDLSFNHLNGSIPLALGGTLPRLKVLGLYNNSLNGDIPTSIGNLSSLVILCLSMNNLRGIIPEELGRLSNLVLFLVSGNLLHGTVPSVLFNISSLGVISAVANQLHGRLPSSFGNKLPKLTVLEIDANKFSGTIPASLSNVSLLEVVSISRNQFSGTVRPIFGRMHGLRRLNLEVNQFQASDGRDLSFIDSLVNCSNLYVLTIAANDLGGVLPLSVTNFSKEMRSLYMDLNHFSGPIPEQIGKLTMLQVLSLDHNKLTGYIPSSVGNLTLLSAINFSENRFEGTIPSTMKTLRELSILLLFNNRLSGRMPGETLGQFFSLYVLHLANNSFVGTIPSEIGSLINLQQLLLNGNRLTGEIPGTISGCPVLEGLNLQGNLFTGSIPPSLSNLKGLRNLDLSYNILSGGIPSSFSNLKFLETIALSNNNLSGSVPAFLQDFKYLSFLDLSYNHFHGELPVRGVFANASALLLVGNVELCGGVPLLHLPVCLKSHNRTSRGSLVLKIVIPAVALLLCLLLLLLFLFFFRQRESRTLSVSHEEFPRVSYYDLVRATDGFSSGNLIGKGKHASVYKGTLDVINNTMMMVAIKVFSLDTTGASRSFLSECESLRSIRHRNLIKIITSCVSIDSQGNDFKALVLDLMPNGSLDSWLHPAENQQQQQQQQSPLSLIQRLNVATDVADALEYLHHSCQPPVVHCDLKPCNVLLDDDMNARVGDFGLAKILMNNSNSNLWQSSTTSAEIIKGTIGYVPPEYGIGGEVSTMGDVFSYGILVLELLTGKKPVDESFKDGLTLRKFVETYASPERIMEIMDPSMFSQEDDVIEYKMQKACVVSVAALGLACSVDSPNGRLSMSHVSAQMHAIRDHYLCVGLTSS